MTWSRERWFICMSVIFLGQVGAIFALHTREPLLVKLPPFPAVRSISPTFHPAVREVQLLTDPMIFAGAHTAGFSAAAWLGRSQLDFELSNSTPAPTFLAFHRQSAGEIFSNNPPLQNAQLPLLHFNLSNDIPRVSRLLLEGAVANRPLATNPPIPIQFATDVLSNTVVQVAIQSDGFPLFTRLVNGSGSRAADFTALEIANNIRFAPQPLQTSPSDEAPEPLQWGRLVFQWLTAEPTATAAAPATNNAAPPKK